MTGVDQIGYRVRRKQTNRNRLWQRLAFPICIRNGAETSFELRSLSSGNSEPDGAKLKRRKLDLFRGVSVVEARREIIKSRN
jgi:hypothetical protein